MGEDKESRLSFRLCLFGIGTFPLARALSREGGDTGIFLCFRGRRTLDTPVVVEHTERSPAAVNAMAPSGRKEKKERAINLGKLSAALLPLY